MSNRKWRNPHQGRWYGKLAEILLICAVITVIILGVYW